MTTKHLSATPTESKLSPEATSRLEWVEMTAAEALASLNAGELMEHLEFDASIGMADPEGCAVYLEIAQALGATVDEIAHDLEWSEIDHQSYAAHSHAKSRHASVRLTRVTAPEGDRTYIYDDERYIADLGDVLDAVIDGEIVA